MDYKPLVREAFEARKYAYAPYSNFLVGASLLGKNGKIYRGCNIENASYSPTNCAERTALFKAVSEGVHEFEAIAVVGGPRDAEVFSLCFPCGVCRQVLTEFCPPDLAVIVARSEDDYEVHTLGELLPCGFGGSDLKL